MTHFLVKNFCSTTIFWKKRQWPPAGHPATQKDNENRIKKSKSSKSPMNKKMSKTALYKVLIGVVGVKSLLQEL